MSAIEIGWARVLIVAVGLTVAVLAYSDAQSSIGSAADMSAHEREELERQDAATEAEAAITRAGLAAKLEAALGEDFGGVWFDPETAQLHVGVTSPQSRRNAEAVAAQAGLAERLKETSVRSTWAQLIAAQERWSKRLADLFDGGRVRTGLAASHNALEVELAPSVPFSRRTALERAASADSVNVLIEIAPSPYLPVRLSARCAKFVIFKAYCDPTIVAGVRVENVPGQSCTAGPAVINTKRTKKEAATETFILTAGHCIFLQGGVGEKWYAFKKAGGERKEVGPATAALENETDIGVIKVNMGTWSGGGKGSTPVDPAMAMWDAGKETDPVEVESQDDPVEKMKYCFSGQRSGTQCGKALKTEEEITVKYDGGKTKLLKKLVKVELATGKIGLGDSGSPWFSEAAKSTVVGVQSSIVLEPESEEGIMAYFHSLKTSFEKLKSEKGIDLELLRKANKRRHPKLKANKYPTTTLGGVSATEVFTTDAGTVECKEGTFHAVLSEESSTLAVTPEYKGCTASFGVSASISMEGCTFVFHLAETVSTDNYGAYTDISCPEGKAITITVDSCKIEIKPQGELEAIDVIDDTSASPKKDITVRPTVSGIAYTVSGVGCECAFNGTGNKTDGEYSGTANVTIAGQNPSEASEKIDIEVAEE